MPYTTVYLQYSETRSDDADYRDRDDEEGDPREEPDYDESEDRVFVEFNPIKLTAKEPRGECLEIELDFEVEVGDMLHLVIVRYNNHRSGVLEEWCVEKVCKNGDEAEELVESLEDGLTSAECAEDKNSESVVVKSEVFSMQVHK